MDTYTIDLEGTDARTLRYSTSASSSDLTVTRSGGEWYFNVLSSGSYKITFQCVTEGLTFQNKGFELLWPSPAPSEYSVSSVSGGDTSGWVENSSSTPSGNVGFKFQLIGPSGNNFQSPDPIIENGSSSSNNGY